MYAFPRSALRYGLVGLLNTGLGFSLIYLSMWLGAPPLIANALGYGGGLAASFTLNRRWSFQSRRRVRSALPRFGVVSLIAFLANWLTVLAALEVLALNPYFAQVSGLGPYLLIGYLGARHYAFTDHDLTH